MTFPRLIDYNESTVLWVHRPEYLVTGAKLYLGGAKWPKNETSEAKNERRRT